MLLLPAIVGTSEVGFDADDMFNVTPTVFADTAGEDDATTNVAEGVSVFCGEDGVTWVDEDDSSVLVGVVGSRDCPVLSVDSIRNDF